MLSHVLLCLTRDLDQDLGMRMVMSRPCSSADTSSSSQYGRGAMEEMAMRAYHALSAATHHGWTKVLGGGGTTRVEGVLVPAW